MRQATYAAAEEYVVHHDYGSGGEGQILLISFTSFDYLW